MELGQQPPEMLFEQAQREIAAGHYIVAHRLLKLAVERAPNEQRYHAALADVQKRLDTATADSLAGLFDSPEEPDPAGSSSAVQIDSMATPPQANKDEDYRSALAAFSDKTAPAPSQPSSSASQKATPKSTSSRSDSSHAKAKTKKARSVVHEGHRGPMATVVVLLTLLTLLGASGFLWWSRQPHTIVMDPYSAILPITKAVRPGEAPEVVLTVQDGAWEKLKPIDKRNKVVALHKAAQSQGFDFVFIYTSRGTRLATAGNGRLWISE